MNRKPQILLIYSLLFFVFLNTSLISCSQDEELIDLVGLEDPKEEPKKPNEEGNGEGEETDPETDGGSEETDNGSDFDSTDGLKISTTPCDFLLSDAASNSTIEIDCRMDLKGQTVNLPAGVTLTYTGGEIINGTLNFSSQGIIDGNLLNKDLGIEGDVQLSSHEFNFYPERWDIVQKDRSFEPAYQNHLNFQKAVDVVHKLKGIIFKVDQLDAFFTTEKKYRPVIELPSDFHFKMTDASYLRLTYPTTKEYASWFFRIETKNNVIISGGNIDGHRDDFGPGIEGANSLIWIKGGVDVLVENVNVKNATLTGLTINGYLFEGDPRYVPSENVVVRGSTFDSNRANNLSITDGKNIIVENCKLYRAGISTNVAGGIAPLIGIVIEPVTGQKVDGVIIRNNILQEGAGKNSILVALGNDVLITGNEADKQVGWTSASNIRIIDNPALRGGIIAGYDSEYALSQSTGNEISGNTIINSSTGIYATNDDILISNNLIKDCTVGMVLTNLSDSDIVNNKIISNVNDSFGINGRKGLNNINISGNEVDLDKGRIISFLGVNSEIENQSNEVIISKNQMSSSKNGVINDSYNIQILDNQFGDGGIVFNNVNNLKFNRNNIYGNSSRSIELQKTKSTKNVEIADNIIENLNSTRLGAYGIKLTSVGNSYSKENTNVRILRNEIKIKGSNYGIHSSSFDGVTISNNSGWVGDRSFIYFRGNNSTITNNEVVEGTADYDIAGNQNNSSGNN